MENSYQSTSKWLNMGAYPVEATATTARVIEALNDAGTAGVTQLANRLELSKSAVHNHLSTLEQLGFAINENGRYRLSLQFLDYGTSVREAIPLVATGRGEVHSLASQSGATAFLVVPEFGVAAYAYVATGGRANRASTEIRTGERVPLHACAPGKAILSTWTAESVNEYLEEEAVAKRTDRTITGPNELRQELRSVKDRGIAFDRGEAVEGVHSVAAPITVDRTAVGALGVSGPADLLSGKRLQEDMPGLILNHATTLELDLTA